LTVVTEVDADDGLIMLALGLPLPGKNLELDELPVPLNPAVLLLLVLAPATVKELPPLLNPADVIRPLAPAAEEPLALNVFLPRAPGDELLLEDAEVG